MMKTDELELTNEWDKTYERDGRADHEKVTFANGGYMYVMKEVYLKRE